MPDGQLTSVSPSSDDSAPVSDPKLMGSFDGLGIAGWGAELIGPCDALTSSFSGALVGIWASLGFS